MMHLHLASKKTGRLPASCPVKGHRWRVWSLLHHCKSFLAGGQHSYPISRGILLSILIIIWFSMFPLSLHRLSKEDRDAGKMTLDIRGTRIVYVSHDANPHGAQHLSLEICRDLRRMHIVVDMVLLDDGPLLEDFAQCASNLLLSQATKTDFEKIIERLKMLHHQRYAIANTVVSGAFANSLHKNGFTVITLIHEMCDFITERNLFDSSRNAIRSSILTIFASETVKRNFENCVKAGPGYHGVTRSQGIYSRYAPDRNQRNIVRRDLGIDLESLIILSCGFGDRRKGIDRFIQVAQRARDPLLAHNSRMLWVGQIHLALKDTIANEKQLCQPACIVIDTHVDMRKFYQASDIFVLFSREDPFPSVVLEAAYAGLPVFLYKGATGLEEFVKSNCGQECIIRSEREMVGKLKKFVTDPVRLTEIAHKSRRKVALQYSWRKYIFSLLKYLGVDPIQVSIVVPTFNSERWIKNRMLSISNQIYPYFEVIVFDDQSTDETIRILNGIQLDIEHIVEKSSVHLGCVFKSWFEGVKLATGDLVWIAEADDLSSKHFLYETIQCFRIPEVSFAFSQSNAIDEKENIVMASYIPYMSSSESGDGLTNPSFWHESQSISFNLALHIGFSVKNWIPNVSAVVFRLGCLKRTLQQNIWQLERLSVAGDWYVYYLMFQCGDLAYHQRILNHHRRRTDSVSSVSHDPLVHLEEVMKVQNMVSKWLPKSNGDEIIKSMDKYIVWLFTEYLSQGKIEQLCRNKRLSRHFAGPRFKRCLYSE